MRLGFFSCALTILLVGCSHLVSSHAPAPAPAPYKVSEIRYVMGTLLDITIYAPSKDEGRRVLDDTFAVAERLDSTLSTWKPESAVSVFNRDPSTELRSTNKDLYDVVAQASRLSSITDGAFTIGIRPLVEMWENAAKRGKAPTPEEVRRARALIAPENFISSPPSEIGKKNPQARIETGGIGKGFAVDEMVRLLRSRGIGDAFINFGRSSIAALGSPPAGTGWTVEVALTEQSSEGTVTLRDETLSVSRARGNPFVINGTSYAHVFDPRTGMPVSVSRGAAIRGPSATDGEALVKDLVIRGAPPSTIAQRWGAVEWIVREDRRVESSKRFLE